MENLEKEQENTQTTPTPVVSDHEKMNPPSKEGGPVEQTAHEETPLLAPVPFYRKKYFLRSLIAIIVIAGAAYYAYTNNIFGTSVAEINGIEISQAEFDESLALIEESATLQGIDLTQPGAMEEIETQALEVLINNALLVSAAEKAGITVSDEEIDEKYVELTLQLGGGEELTLRMEEVGLSEDKLKQNIKDRILADKYIETLTDIENIIITDAEIAEFYETLTASGSEIPPIEDIGEQISAQLLLQTQQQIINSILEGLKSEANIEINI